jgi:hypothetical protein
MTFACFVAVNFPKRSDKVEACVFFCGACVLLEIEEKNCMSEGVVGSEVMGLCVGI